MSRKREAGGVRTEYTHVMCKKNNAKIIIRLPRPSSTTCNTGRVIAYVVHNNNISTTV